ncbi:MAG: adenylate/guanylate cyclase domain-containing protein [Actinomycetota bacterium]
MRTCPSCGEENSDPARFCQACATSLAPAEPSTEVRKVVTIVFADVTGSTALGERLDPETLRRVMGRYFDEMEAVIKRHGGVVEKFIGDAVMAVFGIPRLHEDDPVRAVRAAAEMQEVLSTLNLELHAAHDVEIQVRIGVNSGEVVAGDPATGQRLVTGDAVNVAARLEQAGAPGTVLLGETTYRLVKDAVEVEPVEPLSLKGKSGPVPAFRLVSIRHDATGHERHLDAPLVGREKELARLWQALDHATSERTSHLFTLLGPAGVGKSRLVNEFLRRIGGSATVLGGRCLSYGDGITYFPLSEAVQQAAGTDEVDDRAAVVRKLRVLLDGAEGADRIARLMGGLLGWSEPGEADEAFWAVRKVFEHLAVERPVVLVFDDMHWAEPTFLDLVENLSDWTRDAALMIVCVARPELLELRSGWSGGKMNATSVLLEPLSSEEASSLIDHLLGRAAFPEAARSRILDAAEGNPLFVEEMLAMLIDERLLRLEDGVWHGVDDLAHLAVPPTIQLLLAARLDRLEADERAVIERAAIEGSVFHIGAVTTLAPDALRPRVRSQLLTLARKELIRPDRGEFAGEDAFRFRHLLIRDAAYQAMPKEQRAELHERSASWLGSIAGERLPEYEEILAHHLEQAYRYRRDLGSDDEHTRGLAEEAGARLLASAERARRRGDFSAARALLERCVDVAQGSRLAAALTSLAATLSELTDFPGCVEVAERAIEAASASGDRHLALRARMLGSEARGQIDPSHALAHSQRDIEDSLEELDVLGDTEGVIAGRLAAARMAFYGGDCRRTLELEEELLAHPEALSDNDRLEAATQILVAAYFGSSPLSELRRLGQLARTAMADGPFSEIRWLHHAALLLSMEGRADETMAQLEHIDRLWRAVGDASYGVARYQGFGEAARRLGRSDLAEQYFRQGVKEFDELGETGFNSYLLGLWALALCDLGRFDEAESATARARELAAEDDFASQGAWRLGAALVASARGKHERATSLVDDALGGWCESDRLTAWRGGG